ncbi:MAG: hypothetical protein KDK62_07055 [Chlamydiia bacterium]|nr:hypothetical protein [Chlamydiia bacterium]
MKEIINNKYFKDIDSLYANRKHHGERFQDEAIGRRFSSKASKAFTWFVYQISLHNLRSNYYENYGKELKKAYFTQKASKELPADGDLNQRIARAWKKAQYDPVLDAAQNFVHAQELLRLYNKERPTGHIAADTLISVAVSKLNSAYKNPPSDKSKWTQTQKEAIDRLDALIQMIEKIKTAYDEFPDETSQSEFLDLLKRADEKGVLKEFLDVYQIIKERQSNSDERLLDLNKFFIIADIKSEIPANLSDKSKVDVFYGAHIRLTKEHVLSRVKEEALRQKLGQMLDQNEMDLKAMNALINEIEAREKELILKAPESLREIIIRKHRHFIAIAEGDFTLRNQIAATRMKELAPVFQDEHRGYYFEQHNEKYNLFETDFLEKFEKDFVLARTRDRIEKVRKLAKTVGDEFSTLLVEPLKAMGNDDKKEMDYLAEIAETILLLQFYMASFDEKLVAQLVLDRQRDGKKIGQDSAKDIEDLTLMQSEKKAVDNFWLRIDQAPNDPYNKVLYEHCIRMDNPQILEFLKLPETEKLTLLRPHLNLFANYLSQPGFIEAVVQNQGDRSAEEVISALAKANPKPLNGEVTKAIKGVQKKLEREVALRAVALLLLDLGASQIHRGEITANNALAQIFKGDMALKKSEKVTQTQAQAFSEYLVRETINPHLFYNLGSKPKAYYLELVKVGYELMEEGLTPQQAAQAIAKKAGSLDKLKSQRTIQINEEEKIALKRKIEAESKSNFQVSLLAKDIRSNPLRLIKVIVVSALRGLPHDEREIARLSHKLDTYAPLLSNWQDLLSRSFAENPQAAEQINQFAERAFGALNALQIGIPKETLNQLVDDVIRTALDILGNDPQAGPAPFAKDGINSFLDNVASELRKSDTQNGLIGLKVMLKVIKGGLKTVVFLAPVIEQILNIALPPILNAVHSYLQRQINDLSKFLTPEENTELERLQNLATPSPKEAESLRLLRDRENQFGVLSHEERARKLALQNELLKLFTAFKDTLPALIPPLVNALVQIEKNHSGLFNELGKVIDAAIIKPKTPPIRDKRASDAFLDDLSNEEILKKIYLSPYRGPFYQVQRAFFQVRTNEFFKVQGTPQFDFPDKNPLRDVVKERMGFEIRRRIQEDVRGKTPEEIKAYGEALSEADSLRMLQEIVKEKGQNIFGQAIKQARQQALYDLSEIYCTSRTPKPPEPLDPFFDTVMQALGTELNDEMYRTFFRDSFNQGFQDALFHFGRSLVKDLQTDSLVIDSLLEGLVDNYSAMPSAAQAAKS